MTTISCAYNCKFQKNGICNLNSDSKIVNSSSETDCPYFVAKEPCNDITEKEQKKPLSQILHR